MGQELADLYNRQVHWAHSTPATYAAGAQNIFAITGGIVYITAIIEYIGAMAGATESRILIGAVNLDGGSITIDNVSPDGIIVSPLDPAGAINKVDSEAAINLPSLAGFAASSGVVAAPGQNISALFAGAAMVAADLWSLHVRYRKIHPQALIA